jgi:predicted translin family RNA/ssDNA-binding protein
MNDEDIKQFIRAFEDFMNHADVEMQNYVRREAARKYTKTFFEKQAEKLNVPVDYYIQEFV